jgi:pSer/pThr/pTyr-binding forkhead associated (FHA) protein
MPSLQVLAGPHAGTLVPLAGQTVVLGRGPHCDVVIPMVAISRNHARIVRVGDTYFIEDTNSRSGTFLNNRAIHTRTALRNRDRICICDFVAVYLDEPFGHLPEPIEEVEPYEGTVGVMLETPPVPTEQEWLTSVNPGRMLDLVSAMGSVGRLELIRSGADPTLSLLFPSPGPELHRKLRLFVWACARRIWHRLEQTVNEETAEAAERHAEGEVTDEELERTKQMMRRSGVSESLAGYYAYRERSNLEHYAARAAARAVEAVLGCGHQERCANERAALTWLLRDLFRPFRQVMVDPAWLAWEGGLVGRLARAAYDERCLPEGTLDGIRLAVLADALEDAGCTDGELLEHLRRPGRHVRGCWAVDLLMGK